MQPFEPRQAALDALRLIHKYDKYADAALHQILARHHSSPDTRLTTEITYGATRRFRTLTTIIDQFTQQPIAKQPLDLKLILVIGVYQLLFLDHIPASAAVNTTVELAKHNRLSGLAGLVNAILRQIARRPLGLVEQITDPGCRLSYPDWLLQLWQTEYGIEQAIALGEWFNRSPTLDLRVNPLQATPAQVQAAFQAQGISTTPLPHLPQALRLDGQVGKITDLPGYQQGWWSIQDAASQLVAAVVDPQPGQMIIDACAAPGGKTCHLAELSADQGQIHACDLYDHRLKKIVQNRDRLQLTSIKTHLGDSKKPAQFPLQQADAVLVDAPCSGLGTLHRHADARWRQNPTEIHHLTKLQLQLLTTAATWVKPQGCLVYSTCTLNSGENIQIINQFLATQPEWQLAPCHHPAFPDQIYIQTLPHQDQLDGFFIAKLKRK
ncbi:MAG: 16S rRNA (cytosine(967)-C(5))-methyltransferase [Pseudanabaenaceae cyanobacterium bins.68]|nr:16S rRNA (cytosine(967)-C(5))-methyltransferase [Pseudanabaenaceae cyanobacterium bins.68]